MIDPKDVKFIFDDDNKATSTIVMANGLRQTITRRDADNLAKVLRKLDKAAHVLKEHGEAADAGRRIKR